MKAILLLAPIAVIAFLIAPMFVTLEPIDHSELKEWERPVQSSLCDSACMEAALDERLTESAVENPTGVSHVRSN